MKEKQKGIFIGIIACCGLADTALLIPYTGISNLGTILPGCIGIFLLLYLYNKKKRFFVLKNKCYKNIIRIIFVMWMVSFIGIEFLIIGSLRVQDEAAPDYLMILGAGLHGNQMSLSLQKRMLAGLEYLKKNPEMRVIVSGGQGAGENLSEAEAMRFFLLENDIDASRIIVEDKSTSTKENFLFARKMLKPQERKISILVVTNDFHMFRAKLLASRCGFLAYGMPCRTPWAVLPNCYMREYFAVIKSFFLDFP